MFTASTQCPPSNADGAESQTIRPYIEGEHPAAGVPVTRSPQDVWHDEAYLLSWLVKCHGWVVVGPGELRRYKGLGRSVTSPQNREAGRRALQQRRQGA